MSILDETKLKAIIDQPNQNHLLRIMCYALQGDRKAVENYLNHISVDELPQLEQACSIVIQESRKVFLQQQQVELIFGLTRQNYSTALNALCSWCRHANDQWWRDPATGDKLTRNKGELIALMHSELSEALEGIRKNLPDDKLPQYPMELVEMADCLIRIFDYLGEYCRDQSFGEMFLAKMEYNANRADHKAENRIKEGGKQF